MNIVVVFEEFELNAINGDKEAFGNEIGNASKIICRGDVSEDVDVQVLEGDLPNIPEGTKIVIIVSSSKIINNIGKLIVEFKMEALEIFAKYGIQLDKNSLMVKLNPPYDINKFIGHIRKNVISQENQKIKESDEFDYEQKSKQYVPVEPLYSFERVILPKGIIEKIEEAIGILQCENKVFKEWGLYEIQPHPSTSLSFFGPPGTGKTMAAEAVAHKLGKKILKVSYADVESKFHGEGPKMVKAIFLAASNADAVLFFDEADSLLSKRLTSVSQGSEQAINSMRSQLLICLEEFRGIVIFATNLVVNYDQAFLTRLISVEFKNPDIETRKAIWNVHIKAPNDGKEHQLSIPLAEDVDTNALAEKYDFVGREIRNAVVSACVSAVLAGKEIVTQEDFITACEKTVEEKKALAQAQDHTKSDEILKKAIMSKMEKKTEEEKGNVSEQS